VIELAARTGVNSDHEGVVFTKLKYLFTDFFRYFYFGIRYFSVFGIPTRYLYRYFEIPLYSVSVSVTDPGLVCIECGRRD